MLCVLPTVSRMRKTDHLQSWKPGQSGNPTGSRPPTAAEARQLAAKHIPSVIKNWVEINNDPKAPAAARVKAGEQLFDRAFGKAPLQIEHRHHHEALQSMELGGLLAMIEALRVMPQPVAMVDVTPNKAAVAAPLLPGLDTSDNQDKDG